jgi:hypothetical protein
MMENIQLSGDLPGLMRHPSRPRYAARTPIIGAARVEAHSLILPLSSTPFLQGPLCSIVLALRVRRPHRTKGIAATRPTVGSVRGNRC